MAGSVHDVVLSFLHPSRVAGGEAGLDKSASVGLEKSAELSALLRRIAEGEDAEENAAASGDLRVKMASVAKGASASDSTLSVLKQRIRGLSLDKLEKSASARDAKPASLPVEEAKTPGESSLRTRLLSLAETQAEEEED